jgi:hypothetical protein
MNRASAIKRLRALIALKGFSFFSILFPFFVVSLV